MKLVNYLRRELCGSELGGSPLLAPHSSQGTRPAETCRSRFPSSGRSLRSVSQYGARSPPGPLPVRQDTLPSHLPLTLQPRRILNRADADMTMRYYAPDASADFGLLRCEAQDFKGSPPQFVVYAELDCLRDQAQAYIAKLLSVDVPVGSLLAVGAFHSFVQV